MPTVLSFSTRQLQFVQSQAAGLPVEIRSWYLQTIANLIADGAPGDAAVEEAVNIALSKVHDMLALKGDMYHEQTSIYPRRKVALA